MFWINIYLQYLIIDFCLTASCDYKVLIQSADNHYRLGILVQNVVVVFFPDMFLRREEVFPNTKLQQVGETGGAEDCLPVNQWQLTIIS